MKECVLLPTDMSSCFLARQWKVELEEILEVASADSDQWVSMLAELLRSFPSTGTLNFNIEENSGVFVDLCNDLRKFGELKMPVGSALTLATKTRYSVLASWFRLDDVLTAVACLIFLRHATSYVLFWGY